MEKVILKSSTPIDYVMPFVDCSVKIVESFRDKRIRLINNKHDYIDSLNLGMEMADGKYIARMDADDIMHPDRLLVQFNLMEKESDIDICSTWCTLFNNQSKRTAIYKRAFGYIKNPLITLLDSNIFTHPSMMFRTGFIRKHHLRYERYPYAEDYKINVEAAIKGAKFYIEPQSLLLYRCHAEQVSVKKKAEQDLTAIRIKEEIMNYILPKIPKELQDLYSCLRVIENMRYVKPNYKFNQLYKILKYNSVRI